MWLKSLQQHFKKKRTQQEAASSSYTAEDDAGDLVHSPHHHSSTDDEEFESRPKRRSVSIDVSGLPPTVPMACDRRPSLEQWHEARRARNSLEGQGTTTTDRLTICKAGSTTIVNKTYITIKHLGSGTFGRVMLCFNVYDQRLYAIKVCRKSQFAANVSRFHSTSRLRRSMQQPGSTLSTLQSPSSSSCFTARSCGSVGQLQGPGGNSFTMGSLSSPSAGGGVNPNNSSCAASCGAANCGGVTHICATSGSSSVMGAAAAAAANAAAAAAMFGSSGAGGAQRSSFSFPSHGTWPNSPSVWQQQQQQPQHSGPLPVLPPSPPSPPGAGQQPHQQLPQGWQQQQHRSATPSPVGGGPCRFGALPPPPPTALLSSGGGGGGGLMGTDCSTGSLSGGVPGGGSVFQEAMLRYQTEELVKEIAILKKLHHPNIVNLVEVIDDPSTDSLLLVMEYVEGGTLQPRQVSPGHWDQLPEQEVWRYVREVLQGLDYLHTHKVVHGDLKPANLLLDSNSGKVKIADFGSSIMAGSDKMFSMRNCPGFSTPAFRSPESLTSGYTPSFEMDMWALGVCIYIWVFGCLPFTGGAPFIIYEKIRAQDVSMPSAPDVSPELRDLICQLLDKDVLKRLDIQGTLQHPWVTLGGSAPLVSIRQQEMSGSLAPAGGSSSSCGMGGSLEATQEEIDAAIQQIASGGVSELMDVVFEERVLQPGQQLIAPGQAADCIYLISHGELEIFSPVLPSGSPHQSLSEPLISGLDLTQLQEQADPDVWDSTPVADISKEPGVSSDLMLLSDVLAPWDSSRDMLPPDGLKLLAVKGPGDSLGVPLLPSSSQAAHSSRRSSAVERRWKVSVAARGRAVVFTARLEDLAKLVEAHPEMEGAVKQIVTQQETDMMVAEAMRQLQLFSDCHRSQGGCTDVEMSWQQELRQPAA